MSRLGAHDRSSFPDASPDDDLLASALSEPALAHLERRIETIIARLLQERLPAEIKRAQTTPWLDTKQAAAYLGITENALRLRVRELLVPAHRDGAGRLRFHRDELDQSMRPEPPRRRKR
jgi:excisionase family DNA binding protein